MNYKKIIKEEEEEERRRRRRRGEKREKRKEKPPNKNKLQYNTNWFDMFIYLDYLLLLKLKKLMILFGII